MRLPDSVLAMEETIRQVEAVFRRSTAEVQAMVDALRTVPLPADLAVWESEGGALMGRKH